MRRGWVSLLAILVVSTLVLAVPVDAQSEHPVEVWPTAGWAIADPETQGMNSTSLVVVYNTIED